MVFNSWIRLAIAGGAFLAVVPAAAQQGKWADPNDPTAKSMIAMERQWAEDGCTHNGIVKTLLAEDFQGTSPEGKRYSKSDELEGEKNSKTVARDCRLIDARVRFFGENVALIYGSESSVRKGHDGKDMKRCLIWTDTWLKRNGAWQIVAAQDTLTDCK